MHKSRFKKKEISYKMSMGLYLRMTHELELLYSLLYQLVEYIEIDSGKINAIKESSKFYENEGIKWVIQELQQSLTEKADIHEENDD